MYPEYKQVNDFFQEASQLLQTSKTIEDIFQSIIKRNAKRTYALYTNDKNKIKSINYRHFAHDVYSLASLLASEISESKGNVILKLANSEIWGEVFYALLMSGYTPVLIDAKTNKANTQNLINQSKAVAIISEDVYSYTVKKISPRPLLDEKKIKDFEPHWANEVIFCSSGTTGDVKLMVFNGENLIHQICCSLEMPKETKDIMYPEKLGDIKILAMIPFHHVFGFVAVFLWYTFYGKTIVFPSSNTPSDIQSICRNVGITHVYSVPLFWDSLALNIKRKMDLETESNKAIFDKFNAYNLGLISKSAAGKAGLDIARKFIQNNLLGSQVRFCISGGGYLSSETLKTINGIGYPLHDGYGMTEMGVTSVDLSDQVNVRLKGSIGHPFNGVIYKIKDDKESGELLVKSPTIHIREIIAGEEKETHLDEEGYLATGDIVNKDEDGNFYIKGRIKEVIINADGENIFPDELEIYFKSLPHATRYSVLGIKNENVEEICLVLELDNSVEEEDLMEIERIVKETVLPHNVKISQIYLAKGKLPLANNMKVKRFLIKKEIEECGKEFVPLNSTKKKKTLEGLSEDVALPLLIEVREIFSKVLILPKFKIEDDDHWINNLGGDSMNYVEMVKNIEEKFNITIAEEKYGSLTCVNDFVLEIAELAHTKA